MTDTDQDEIPVQDRALKALADLLEALGDEVGYAFVRNRPEDLREHQSCKVRAVAVTRAIIALPSITLHGASAKARATRASTAMALLPADLVETLGFNMSADVLRLRGGQEAGHA